MLHTRRVSADWCLHPAPSLLASHQVFLDSLGPCPRGQPPSIPLPALQACVEDVFQRNALG